MKSVFGFVTVALLIIVFFQGMLIVFEDADKSNLNDGSQELYDTLLTKTNTLVVVNTSSSSSNINFSRDNPQLSDENAFSVEFFTASTSNQNKISQLDTMKAAPELIMFSIGSQNDFGWFYDNILWYIGFLIVLIGFVILFRREVY